MEHKRSSSCLLVLEKTEKTLTLDKNILTQKLPQKDISVLQKRQL